MADLMAAHRQWANRAADERFETLEAMLDRAEAKKRNASEFMTTLSKISVRPIDGEGIEIVGTTGKSAPTNFAAEQLLTSIGLPNRLTSLLSAEIMSDAINYRLQQEIAEQDREINVLLDKSDPSINTVRAITSARYGRVFDSDLIPFLMFMRDNRGWRVPLARPAMGNQPGTRKATEQDIINYAGQGGGVAVKVGDDIAPAGLYMGDRDMFAIMVNPQATIDDGTGRPMTQGFYLSNSEVGNGSLNLVQFNCNTICGNHIIWGATNIVQVKYRHIGDCFDRTMKALDEARDKLSVNTMADNRKVFDLLRKHEISKDKFVTTEGIYKLRLDPVLSQKTLEQGWDFAEQYAETDHDTTPGTPLGIVAGLTRYSQTMQNADRRFEIDRAAGKIMSHYAKALVTA